jgi:hypothetical protein
MSLIMPLHTCGIDANRPLSVYKDESPLPNQGLDRVRSKENNTSWRVLGTRAERNKENNMMPAKWTSHKVLLPCHLGFSEVAHVRLAPRTTIQ